MLSDTHRWPDGAVVIPSDLPEFGAAVAEAVGRRAPFVLVFPDCQEIVFQPSPTPSTQLSCQTHWRPFASSARSRPLGCPSTFRHTECP